MKKWLGVVILALGLLLGVPGGAVDLPQRDPAMELVEVSVLPCESGNMLGLEIYHKQTDKIHHDRIEASLLDGRLVIVQEVQYETEQYQTYILDPSGSYSKFDELPDSFDPCIVADKLSEGNNKV